MMKFTELFIEHINHWRTARTKSCHGWPVTFFLKRRTYIHSERIESAGNGRPQYQNDHKSDHRYILYPLQIFTLKLYFKKFIVSHRYAKIATYKHTRFWPLKNVAETLSGIK